MRDLEWLQDYLSSIDRVFWHDELAARGVTIRWRRFRPVKTWFTYGCYWPDRKLIEISPVLQHLWVPSEVVGFSIYHESVHAMQDPEPKKHSAHYAHDRDFWAAELRYPHAAFAAAWDKANALKLVDTRPPLDVSSS